MLEAFHSSVEERLTSMGRALISARNIDGDEAAR